MREIIYVQAGTTANYVGTHFWNEQDHYATVEVDAGAGGDEQERIDHAKSFSIREDPDTARIMSFAIPRSAVTVSAALPHSAAAIAAVRETGYGLAKCRKEAS